MLSTFPKETRIKMLQKMKELQPLFQQFGVSTMSDVLTKELQGEKRRPVAKHANARRQQHSNLQHIRRTYQLIPHGENLVPGYPLPSLTLHEGVVLVNKQVQPRASI